VALRAVTIHQFELLKFEYVWLPCDCRIRGEVKFQSKDFQAALADFNKALELQHDDVGALR